jgi:electron transport complex protein RnfB
MADDPKHIDRRGFVTGCVRVLGAVGLGGLASALVLRKGRGVDEVWQIQPDHCIACDRCQTHCVLDVSAVKCVQCFALCGYCDVCTGYFPTKYDALDTGAENQLCPTGAISRKFVEQNAGTRYFEYTIDESLCIACGKCVTGCRLMNGSLYLQVRHDRCLNCNECSIAVACPTQAFRRVPADRANLLGRAAHEAQQALDRKQAAVASSGRPTTSPLSLRKRPTFGRCPRVRAIGGERPCPHPLPLSQRERGEGTGPPQEPAGPAEARDA